MKHKFISLLLNLPIAAEVPQGSVVGPLIYLLFIADLRTSPDITVATYAHDMAILSMHENSRELRVRCLHSTAGSSRNRSLDQAVKIQTKNRLLP